MKKLFLVVLSVVGLSLTYAYAEMVTRMLQGPSQALATADYGGVDISTSNFNASFTTVTTVGVSVYGVTFSSGSCSDFAQIYATGTWVPGSQGGASTETIRIYNLGSSTQSVGSPGLCAGYTPIGTHPVRLDALGWRLSTAGYNSVILHYFITEVK